MAFHWLGEQKYLKAWANWARSQGLESSPHSQLYLNNISTGLPRVTYLAVTVKRNRRTQHQTSQYRQVSGQTLRHIGLYARRPVRCVPLTATHCRLRLTWSREHALWTPQQWSCVMFSDESRFSLQSDYRRTLIWRAPGTRYHH
ncbi:transposable element Tcb1 transposase [Trichonephila clavipes]|uniref:Transposable element Tcb1 transposase n=1 Tax=Trichonephila clavipes TaxID=2585209 RepID=A0A8X6UYM3_TRICX|nr:transposable element Tcb1 transposase [Trichonephila clavipes]